MMIDRITNDEHGNPIALIDERDQTLLISSGRTVPCPCCGQDLMVKTSQEWATDQGKRIAENALSAAWDKSMAQK
jgi:hypothetical protein